jgi:CRP-like cAMP-binding protein
MGIQREGIERMAETIVELKGAGRPVLLKKGDLIYEEDQAAADPCVYYILEGNIELSKKYTPLQKEIFVYGPGDPVGILEVYTHTRRITNARAATDVKAVALGKDDLEKTIMGNLQFALHSIRILSKMLRQVNERIKKLPEVK